MRLFWAVCVSVLRARLYDIYIVSGFVHGVGYVVSVVADDPWTNVAGMASGFGEGCLCV